MSFTERDARLARLSAAIVLGRWDELRAVRGAAPPGEPDLAWREAVLQTHLFAGFPRLVEAYDRLAELGGLGEAGPEEARAEADLPQRGRELFERIYTGAAELLEQRLRAHHADFGAWVLGHAYGRVLTRPGLGADRRELYACACLVALGQDRQLASHARGALRCGAERAELLDLFGALEGLVDPAALELGRALAQRLRTRG